MLEGRLLKTPMARARISLRRSCYLCQGISHPNTRRYETLVVGWLYLDHNSRVVEWNRFFCPVYFGLSFSNRLLTNGVEVLCSGLTIRVNNA